METLNEVQNNEVQNEKTNETKDNRYFAYVKAVKLFDENVTLILDKQIPHKNEEGNDIMDNYVSLSYNKAMNLLDKVLFTVGIEYPKIVFNLLLEATIFIEKIDVAKGETINGFTYQQDGYYYSVVLDSLDHNRRNDALIDILTTKAINGEYNPKPKEVKIPSFA